MAALAPLRKPRAFLDLEIKDPPFATFAARFRSLVRAPGFGLLWTMTSPQVLLQFWHGSHRWDGRARLQDSRTGQYELGPGLYLTTNVVTAAKYAKGGGRILRVSLESPLSLLSAARLPLKEVLEGLSLLPRVKARSKIAEDLKNAAEDFGGEVPLSYLVNLCIAERSLGGRSGKALAEWLAENGVDASLEKKSGGEEWLVIFNVSKVMSVTAMTAAAAHDIGNFPALSAQLLAPSRRCSSP
jgi:hypothetical protein